MLSKEEIEISYIEVPIPLNPEELEREYRDLYIRHKILLGEKQNIIEKLEEDKETLKKENADGTLQDYVIRLLEILKGE